MKLNKVFGPIRQESARLISLRGVLISGTLALLISMQAVFAVGSLRYVGPTPNTDFKTGFVLARSVVLDPDTNEPILVEFGIDGKEVKRVDVDGDYRTSDLIVYPAADYRFHQTTLTEYNDKFQDSLAKDAQLMTRREFEQADFFYADNETPLFQEPLPKGINSVLVRAQSGRIRPLVGVTQSANQILLLLSFDVDLTQAANITDDEQSLVLNEFGQVVARSTNAIGYRVGFFGDPNEPDQRSLGRINTGQEDESNNDTIYGPVPFTKVYVDEFAYPGGIGATDRDGRYSFRFYLGMCPVGGFSYTTDVWAELRYRNFLPTGAPSIPYYLRTSGYSYCYADLVPSSQASSVSSILATNATGAYQSNLYVDVMFLSGRISMRNSQGQNVPIGDTTYTVFDGPADISTPDFYDFNGDGRSDHVVQGRMIRCQSSIDSSQEKDLFLGEGISTGPILGEEGKVLQDHTCEQAGSESWQGVFFDGAQNGVEDFPDLVRVGDTEFRNEAVGVLQAIAKADMRNTDVYLFRESTGQLILERRGLKQKEADYRPAVEYDAENKEVAYRIMLRGNRDWNLNIGGGVKRHQSFDDWATEYQLTEPFRQREADHPRPGEYIKVVAINRATGYTGTARVQLTGAANNGVRAGLLDVETPPITLRPPNLRIWAERDYDVEAGATKGEERNYIIGNEGAALHSDTVIRLYTEWLDEQGKPLPDELGLDGGAQYGLTGRLAKVVGPNQLRGTALADDMAEFPIAPGRNTQIVRVGNGANASTDHFYVHVIGKGKEQECVPGARCPKFDLISQQAGLEGRPALLTPFLTPLWDERKSWLNRRNYLAFLQGHKIDSSDSANNRPIQPAPSYAWQYRPEYQFSQFDFTVDDINREFEDPSTSDDVDPITIVEDVLDDVEPVIGSDDNLVNIFYSLIGSQIDRLIPIDGHQEIILSLGGNEIRVLVDRNGQITFDNLSALADLSYEDLISLRLYTNNDEGNVLWEYQYDVAKSVGFSRTTSLATFNASETSSGSLADVTDSFQQLNISLNESSEVEVEILNESLRPVAKLVRSSSFDPGQYAMVVTYGDIAKDINPDKVFYIAVSKTGTFTKEKSRDLYVSTLSALVDSEILGQVIEHDTLIQRGALTLRREDIKLSGVGPQLDFIRSYSNEQKLTHEYSTLGPGWNHNHNIYLKVLSQGDVRGIYGNNLPVWIQDVRSGDQPTIVDVSEFPDVDDIPQLITVSNGGLFVYRDGVWRPSRGYHGRLLFTDGHYEFTSKDGTRYVFDSYVASATDDRYLLQKVIDRNGNELTYEYQALDATQYVSRVTDATNRSLHFSYEANSDSQNQRLTTVTSPEADIALEFEYAGTQFSDSAVGPTAASLLSFSRADFTEQYDYLKTPVDLFANLISTTDAVGNVTQYSYMAPEDVPQALLSFAKSTIKTDVVSAISYPGNTGTSAIEYVFGAGNQRKVTDLNGNETLYTLNQFGNPTIIDAPLTKQTLMVWSIDQGEDDVLMIEQTDALGRTTSYDYDEQGNVTKIVDPIGTVTQTWNQQYSLLEQRTDRNGNRVTNDYDARGNLISETDAEGFVSRHSYNAKGLRLTTRHPDNGGTSSYAYDGYGNLALNTLPQGSGYSYINDARGNVTRKTDANNHIYRYRYDALDRLIEDTHPDGFSLSYQYDAKGNKLSETDKLGLTLSYEYDARDRVATVTRNFGGGSQSFTYDNQSNLLSETDWLGNTTTHQYDGLYRRTKMTNRLGDSMSMSYDLVNNLLTEKDYRGLDSEHAYDTGDRKIRSVNRVGDPMLYTYDDENNLLTSTDYAGRVTQHVYDKRYLKTQTINPIGGIQRWTYDGRGNALTATDAQGRLTKTEYDRQNRVVMVEDALKYVSRYEYDGNDNLIRSIDRRGTETRYEFDKLNRLVKTTDGDGFDWANSYDANNNKTASTDGHGNTTDYVYDRLNRLTQETSPVNGRIAHVYDANNNLRESTDAIGTVYKKDYDKLDRLTVEEEAASSSDARSKTSTYDPNGNVLSVNNFRGHLTQFEYDDLDRVDTVTDALNQTTRHTYDKVSNKLSTTDRRGHSTSYQYDDLDRLTRTTDALNQTIRTTYDAVGNAISVTDKRGTATSNEFDALNRLLTSTKPDGLGNTVRIIKNEYDGEGNMVAISDANNNRSRYEYNARNLQTKVLHPNGTQALTAYDGAHNKTSLTDEIGQVTTLAYDAANRLISSTNFANEVTVFEYDLNNNKTRVTQPLGNALSYQFDALNRVSQATDGESNTTRYSYDNNNNQASHTDANGNTVSYTYDELDRRTRHNQPNGLFTTASYDPEGNMVGRTDQNGQTFTYQFDEINRQVTQVFPNVLSPYMRIVEIDTTYDGNNNPIRLVETKFNALSNATEQDVSEMSYDQLDRKTQDLQRGHRIDFSYDANGNRLSVQSAGGTTGYGYDSRNRLISATTPTDILSGAGGTSTYTYTADSKQDRVSYPNGTVTRYTYDDADRVLSATNERTGAVAELISSFVYSYDVNSNRLSQVETQNGFAQQRVQTTTYEYDNTNRMTGYAITDQDSGDVQSLNYTFDNNYNRTREVETLTRVTLGAEQTTTVKDRTSSFDANNRISRIVDELDPENKSIDYVYDNNGNTLSKTDATQSTPELTTFEYDSRNQLVRLSRGPPSSQTAQGLYDYNARGFRVRHRNSERGDIEYLYDDKSILEERTLDTDTLLAHYRYSDRLISLSTETDEQYYHYSALRTTANLTNKSGDTQVSYRTDVWGHITNQEGDSPNRQVFTGQEHDEQTGLIYFGARYYDPDTARFINQDSYLGESLTPPSLHRYLYAYGNPSVYIDLHGYLSQRELQDGSRDAFDNGDIVGGVGLSIAQGGYAIVDFLGGGFLENHDAALDEGFDGTDALFRTAEKQADVVEQWGKDRVAEGAVVGAATAVCGAARLCKAAGKLASEVYDKTKGKIGAAADKAKEHVGKAKEAVSKAASKTQDKIKALGTKEKRNGPSKGEQRPDKPADSAQSDNIESGSSADGPDGGVEVLPGNPLYGKSPDDKITVYRGVHGEHDAISDARQGMAKPIGGHTDPELHNMGDNHSEFTSWTTDKGVAQNRFASGSYEGKKVEGGVILKDEVKVKNLQASPDMSQEAEVLRRGDVEGAEVIDYVRPEWDK